MAERLTEVSGVNGIPAIATASLSEVAVAALLDDKTKCRLT